MGEKSFLRENWFEMSDLFSSYLIFTIIKTILSTFFLVFLNFTKVLYNERWQRCCVSKWQPYSISVPLDLKFTCDTRLILNINYIRLKIKPNSVRIRFFSCQIFVLPSTGFELTPLIHCSTNRLALSPAP